MADAIRHPVAIRILICYVTAGAGHRRAAEAIAQAAAHAFPQAELECRDLLEDVPAWLRRAYPRTYYFLVRRVPLIWAACFALLDHVPVYPLAQPLRRWWNLLMARRFIERLKRTPPDVIVTTHFFPTDVVGACKQAGWLHAPLVVVVTDLHPHRFWLSAQADAYVMGVEAGAAIARQRGIPQERLHVLGIPIGGASHASVDRHTLRRQLGLHPDRFTVLITSGGNTVGPFARVVGALLDLEPVVPGRLQLIVVCGDNAAAVRRLQARAGAATMPARVFGFIDNMPEVMAASDLAVTKAGGVTVSEALGRGLPLVLFHVIPGQEQLNAQYVAAHGAGLIALSPAAVARTVRWLVEDPSRLEAMRRAGCSLSRPDAAAAIVSQVIAPLVQGSRPPPSC